MKASSEGHVECVKELLDGGAQINEQDIVSCKCVTVPFSPHTAVGTCIWNYNNMDQVMVHQKHMYM